MGLKDMFTAMRKEGYVTGPLNRWLFENSNKSENDRAINVNAPSAAGNCVRANFYARTGAPSDGTIDARLQRIFDNGTHVHLRIQQYLTDMDLLLMDEVPVMNLSLNIQGHTDGYIKISEQEIAILEIKSINDKQFSDLHDAKEQHKRQGLIYLYCAEERRKYLRETYKTEAEFNDSYAERFAEFEKRYQHLQSGRKFSREEKIQNEVMLNMVSDNILFHTEKPVNKVIFLYENKNTQDLKEFCVERNMETEDILQSVLEDYRYLNTCVKFNKIPDRESDSKSSQFCRWCNYKNTCWVV